MTTSAQSPPSLCPAGVIGCKGSGSGTIVQIPGWSFSAVYRESENGIGINSKDYAGHSFRIGATTTAAERGVEDSLIKMLGWWQSSAYQIYIKTPQEVLAGISRHLSCPTR